MIRTAEMIARYRKAGERVISLDISGLGNEKKAAFLGTIAPTLKSMIRMKNTTKTKPSELIVQFRVK